jgi:hypothetical protein
MVEKPLVNRYFGIQYRLYGAKTPINRYSLNRYKSDGVGMPFEVQPGYFDDVLTILNKIQFACQRIRKAISE